MTAKLPATDESKLEILSDEVRKALITMRTIDPDWHGDIRTRIAVKGGRLDFAGVEAAAKTVKFER